MIVTRGCVTERADAEGAEGKGCGEGAEGNGQGEMVGGRVLASRNDVCVRVCVCVHTRTRARAHARA